MPHEIRRDQAKHYSSPELRDQVVSLACHFERNGLRPLLRTTTAIPPTESRPTPTLGSAERKMRRVATNNSYSYVMTSSSRPSATAISWYPFGDRPLTAWLAYRASL